MKFSRRIALEILGASALAPVVAADPQAAAQVPAPPKEGNDTPKIAVGMGDSGAEASRGTPAPDPSEGPRRIKQIGVNYVLGGGPQAPWTEESFGTIQKRWSAAGITVGNLMINLSSDILYGKEGAKRDDDIAKIKRMLTRNRKASQ